jgi:hypothetical protein
MLIVKFPKNNYLPLLNLNEMEKKTVKVSVKSLNEMAVRIPKTIKEAMDYEGHGEFNDQYDDVDVDMDVNGVDSAIGVNTPDQEEKPAMEGGMDVKGFIDDIRKKSLKGMAQLADTPDDPSYETLKRIWQICDKAYADNKQAAPGQQPGTGNNMQQ